VIVFYSDCRRMLREALVQQAAAGLRESVAAGVEVTCDAEAPLGSERFGI
jgi:hypothetical protein